MYDPDNVELKQILDIPGTADVMVDIPGTGDVIAKLLASRVESSETWKIRTIRIVSYLRSNNRYKTVRMAKKNYSIFIYS